MLLGMEDEEDEDLSNNRVVKCARACTPAVTDAYHGADFFFYTEQNG